MAESIILKYNNQQMSKSKIILDGPSFYSKLGRFYEKW